MVLPFERSIYRSKVSINIDFRLLATNIIFYLFQTPEISASRNRFHRRYFPYQYQVKLLLLLVVSKSDHIVLIIINFFLEKLL